MNSAICICNNNDSYFNAGKPLKFELRFFKILSNSKKIMDTLTSEKYDHIHDLF